MFSQAESAAISEQYTAVHMQGGNDLDDEGKAFMSRYGVTGYPTLLAMTADGAVISRRFDRTTEGIISAMEGAATANEEFLAKEIDLATKTDEESVRELAGLYRERAQWEDARKGYDQLVGGDAPQADDQLALLDVVTRLGDVPARKAMLGTLVATRKDDERHLEWRMDLATVDIPTNVSSREEYQAVMAKRVEPLTKLLAEVEKTDEQAVVRNALANALANSGDVDTAMGHWDWILENAPDSEAAGGALWIKARMLYPQAMQAKDVEKLKSVKAMLEQLIEKHPDHGATRMARGAIPQVTSMIAKLEAEAAAAAEPEDQDESSSEDDESSAEDDESSDEDDESSDEDDESSDEDDESSGNDSSEDEDK